MHVDQLLPERFIPHCKILPAVPGPPIPFRLWDFQREVLDDFETHQQVIVLKARQLGLSWLALAYALWLVTCNQGVTVLILNQGLREATDLLERVKFMHDHLPDHLRIPRGKDRFDEITFPTVNGRIISLPATENAGSGYTAALVLVDEWAKIKPHVVEDMFTSLVPTLAAGGKLIGVSTAYGYHNFFADQWRDAIDESNELHPIFIPWHAHPDRDQAWYKRQARILKKPSKVKQEYPGEWKEAFQLPGNVCFEEWDRIAHGTSADLRDLTAGWPVTRAMDFGWHFSPVYWMELQANNTVYVFDELDARGMTTAEAVPLIIERDKINGVYTAGAPIGVDPAGKAQTSTSTQSDHDTLRGAGLRVMGDKHVAPKERVSHIKDLLITGRLLINVAKCPMLAESFEQALWDTVGKDGPKKETYKKDGYYEHYLDSLGYGLIYVIPIEGRPVGLAGHAAGVLAGTDRYNPSSDFG